MAYSDSAITRFVNKLDTDTLDRMNIIIEKVLIHREREILMSKRYAQTQRKQLYYNYEQQFAVHQTQRIPSTQENKDESYQVCRESPNGHSCKLIKITYIKTDQEWNDFMTKHSNKPVVVFFTATWCGPCKQIAPLFTELAKENDQAKFIKVDTANLANPDFAKVQQHTNITGMPTFHIYKNKTRVAKVVGRKEVDLRIAVNIHANGCVIYVRETCPHCINAIKLLDKLRAKYLRIPITPQDITSETALRCFTLKTEDAFPAIFIGGIYIGGNDKLQKLNNDGKLESHLTENNAILSSSI